jgi:hypothetical protein
LPTEQTIGVHLALLPHVHRPGGLLTNATVPDNALVQTGRLDGVITVSATA